MSFRILVGCYAPAGIRRFTLDPVSGLLAPQPGPVPEDAPDASFLVLHPSGRFLYAIHERDDFDGKPQGAVSAWRIDPATGNLSLINRVGSGGAHPCHLSLAPSGRLALVAHYSGGTVAALPIGEDGGLGPATVSPVHARPTREVPPGSGLDPERQTSAHAHCILPHPSGSFAVAADLGVDALFTYPLGAGATLPPPSGILPLPPGRGPRHLAFHPLGRLAYAVGELDPVLSVLACDPVTGRLRPVRDLPLLPANPGPGRVYPSEVKLHPSGRLLVAALRGAGEGAFDGFALFTLDAEGNPNPAGHGSTGGGFTRHFAFSPDGRYLVAALQKGNALTAFRVDVPSLSLTPCGSLAIDGPAAVAFY